MSTIDLASIGLGSIRKIVDLWGSSRADSLIDYTRQMRVEPYVVIDNAVLFNDMLPDVMQSLQNIFAGYYLQAVAVSATIGNIHVARQLDKLSPNRQPIDAIGHWMLATENYKNGLPTFERKAAMEAADAAKGDDPNGAAGVGRDAIDQAKELANLSVGKLLEVQITDGQHKGTIPVALRLIATGLPSDKVAHMLSQGSEDVSVGERWHGFKSGRLEFIKDLILCRDLIEERRRNLMADKDDVYSNIIARQRNNKISGLLTGNPSVATASNMVVMNTDTQAMLELKTNAKFSDFKSRERLLKETSIMIVAVIDPSWDRVTFYHRGIPQPTSLSARDLKVSNKGSGPDVSDILKAYQLGNAPRL